MTTKFVTASIVCAGFGFTIDGNGKITAGRNGEYGDFNDPRPNAFSLPAISTCPGSTVQCRSSCYVVTSGGLEDRNPDLERAYRVNAAELARALLTPRTTLESAHALGHWIGEHCPSGFRWHVSGDVQHARHAHWIAEVCAASRMTRHWIYTRTFDRACLEYLLAPANLTLNLSADNDNLSAALDARRFCAGKARICYLTSNGQVPELPKGSVVFPDYSLRNSGWFDQQTMRTRRAICPADQFGKSESLRCGPCTKCIRPVQIDTARCA